jgi:protein required for attachment to host cells
MHADSGEIIDNIESAVLVLVTDGAHARILQKNSNKDNLHQTQNITFQHETTHEHGDDRPGRTFDRNSTSRHAYQPKTDWHDHQKELFIKTELTTLITQMLDKKRYHKLFLICPPKIMGFVHLFMKPHLAKHTKNKKLTVHEISKDLTHSVLADIEACINKVI